MRRRYNILARFCFISYGARSPSIIILSRLLSWPFYKVSGNIIKYSSGSSLCSSVHTAYLGMSATATLGSDLLKHSLASLEESGTIEL